MSDPTVYRTILAQLGGNRFLAMTGAKGMTYGDDRLTIRIGQGAKDGINSVRIILDATDTYTVEMFKIRGTKLTVIDTTSGLYADMLQKHFTEKTGFDTRF